jgi:hypothetical protein
MQERAAPVGSIVWPTLTPTNYMEWALVMQINLEASLLWEVVKGFPMSVPNDKAALGAILRSVPPDMVGTLAMKKTVKEAWETVKTMCLGVDRVKKATAQRLHKEFAQIHRVARPWRCSASASTPSPTACASSATSLKR